MDQFIYFAINMLYAVCLCVSVAMGIVFCISGRTFGTQKKLQRYFGVFLLLFAAHLLILNINLFFGKFADSLLQHVLVIADLIALLCCAVFILKSLIGSYSSEHSELSEPRVNDRSGSGKASGTHAGPEDIGDSELSIESVSHETSENSLPVEDEVEESEDESETVEKLESPNVYDYLFFQKVEALMVNEKLFCEQGDCRPRHRNQQDLPREKHQERDREDLLRVYQRPEDGICRQTALHHRRAS